MKKIFIITLLLCLLVGCKNAPTINPIEKKEVVDNNGFVYTFGSQTETSQFIDNNFYYRIENDGDLLFELAKLEDIWYLNYYDENTLFAKTNHVEDLNSFIELFKTAYTLYLDSTNLEIVKEGSNTTIVQAEAKNPFFESDDEENIYTYRFILEEKEIELKLSDDIFKDLEVVSGDLPIDFDLTECSISVEDNILYYYDAITEEYYDFPLELINKETIKPSETIIVTYEYNALDKITAISFPLKEKEARYDFLAVSNTISFAPNENYKEATYDVFASYIWMALLQIGINNN